MEEDLLPCPFCGEKAGLESELYELSDWSVVCRACGAESSPDGTRYSKESAINDWNTRFVGGRKVVFIHERAGVVAPSPVWFVFSGSYMYGPCENWQDVENQIRNEWEHDRHLVG